MHDMNDKKMLRRLRLSATDMPFSTKPALSVFHAAPSMNSTDSISPMM